MLENHPGRLRSLGIGALVAIGALTLAVGPVTADTEKGHTGKVGDHYLNDISGYQGTVCRYDEVNGQLEKFEVKQPNVWARNRTTHRDSQKVGWRVIIKGQHEGTSQWNTVFTSSIKKATAYDDQTAPFSIRTFQAPALPAHASARYLVFVKMFWYKPDGSVAGTALHRVDVYLEVMDPSQTEFAYCPSSFQV